MKYKENVSLLRMIATTLLPRSDNGRGNVSAFTALKNLSLHIKDGERVGLVGNNGAGKSTLLKMISGIYEPTVGSVHVEGKVISLLNLNVGISLDLTGWENIIRLSLLLGISKKEAYANIEEITEFTELGAFINSPVKTYSLGMLMRLLFAVATSGKPEILLLDEVISVGDAQFQKKAINRIETLMYNTSIVVLASHSEEIIRTYCNRCIRLHNAEIVDDYAVG